MIGVDSAMSVSTEEGIRLGSTEADVLAAYPGSRAQGRRRRPPSRAPAGVDDGNPALAFLVVNSKVVQHGDRVAALVEAQEYCS